MSEAMGAPRSSKAGFRDYGGQAVRPAVEALYRDNHRFQTFDFVQAKKREYGGLDHAVMDVWQALEQLDRLVDDSDPDTELSQLDHALQTAEAVRRAGHPDWLVLTALIHDLGKVLCLFGEPQWAVVGDTFPVGCAFRDEIVHAEHFLANPDRSNARFQTRTGIYDEGCGLDQVHFSWGHDEYLYRVVHERLPWQAAYVIRYHSFYAQHQARAYDCLLDARDEEGMLWVRRFQPFDLYSKGHDAPDPATLRPRYEELVHEFFPAPLRW